MSKYKKRPKKIFYMAVTPDKYELPLHCPLTADEMAEKYNVKKNTIYSCVCRDKKGTRSGRKFVRVTL